MNTFKKATFKPLIFDVVQFDGSLKNAREISEWVVGTLGEWDEKWNIEYKTDHYGEPSVSLDSKTTSILLFKSDWLTYIDGRFEASDDQTFNRLFHISEGQ